MLACFQTRTIEIIVYPYPLSPIGLLTCAPRMSVSRACRRPCWGCVASTRPSLTSSSPSTCPTGGAVWPLSSKPSTINPLTPRRTLVVHRNFKSILRRDHQKNSCLWVGRRKEPILGYVPKKRWKKEFGPWRVKGWRWWVVRRFLLTFYSILRRFTYNKPSQLISKKKLTV